MQRVDVVPWSIAATTVLMRAGHEVAPKSLR
jgi:hypothetical protein